MRNRLEPVSLEQIITEKITNRIGQQIVASTIIIGIGSSLTLTSLHFGHTVVMMLLRVVDSFREHSLTVQGEVSLYG